MLSAMSSTVHVVRHGEVENPEKILYGRQPGWRLSTRGQEMAQVIGEWSKAIDLGALHVSPLQRAQETAAPIAKAHGIAITTDERLIEAANIFEGKSFELGSGVLKHPGSWRHLYNPWKPSWGEPYEEQINRMLAAIFAAKKAANGKDAIVVSHQLPIWITRSAIGGDQCCTIHVNASAPWPLLRAFTSTMLELYLVLHTPNQPHIYYRLRSNE